MKEIEIKPAYVTAKQAKHFKDKGFNIRVNAWYNNDNLSGLRGYFKNSEINPEKHSALEQWMGVEFLRVKYGIWITVDVDGNDTFMYTIVDETIEYSGYEFKTPQEAYSKAFDYIFENNLI
jgi:hypothetical protein